MVNLLKLEPSKSPFVLALLSARNTKMRNAM